MLGGKGGPSKSSVHASTTATEIDYGCADDENGDRADNYSCDDTATKARIVVGAVRRGGGSSFVSFFVISILCWRWSANRGVA